jgi:hypothetical protein
MAKQTKSSPLLPHLVLSSHLSNKSKTHRSALAPGHTGMDTPPDLRGRYRPKRARILDSGVDRLRTVEHRRLVVSFFPSHSLPPPYASPRLGSPRPSGLVLDLLFSVTEC